MANFVPVSAYADGHKVRVVIREEGKTSTMQVVIPDRFSEVKSASVEGGIVSVVHYDGEIGKISLYRMSSGRGFTRISNKRLNS